MYSLTAAAPTRTDVAAAVKALAAMERARSIATEKEFNYLVRLAKLAFYAGRDRAERGYANLLLQQAPGHQGKWNHGNAIHEANSVLGKIALREGKMDDAKKFLLASAERRVRRS